MLRPLQPNFKIRVYSRGKRPTGQETFASKGGSFRATKGNYDFIDVEGFAAYGVTYIEQENLINSLSFTIDKEASVLIHRFYIGQWVVFYGGYYDSSGQGMRKVFSGTITRVRTELPDNGKISFSIEALSYGYNQLAKNKKNFTYPDQGSDNPRSFVKGKSSIKLTDIVKGIVEESGMQIGEITLSKSFPDKTYQGDVFRYQKMQTDWALLNQLASENGCTVWTETIEGIEYVYFVETDTAKARINSEKGFLYPLQGEVSTWNEKATKRRAGLGKRIVDKKAKGTGYDGGYVIDDATVRYINENEWIKTDDPLWDRPRLLRSCTITEDVADAYSVSRSAMYYDKTSGEFKQSIAEIREEDGRMVTYMYELDENKVRDISEKRPDIAEQIRSGSPLSFEWSSGGPIENEQPTFARYYYRQLAVYEEDQAVFDKMFFGITIEATCNMDLDIRAHRSYPIRGIVRYNSNNVIGNYYLMEVRHIWDSTGSYTELKFMK